MFTKISHPQEVSAAIGLLRAWRVVPGDGFFPPGAVDEVVKRYAQNRLYDFGSNLFEHLSLAAGMPNQWVLEGPNSVAGALSELERFLYKTTTASTHVDMVELRREFEEIAKRIKKEYGAVIKWSGAQMPLQNIRRAEKEEAALWAAAHKAGQKGA